MKLEFINLDEDLPLPQDVDYVQTKDGKHLWKSDGNSLIKYERVATYFDKTTDVEVDQVEDMDSVYPSYEETFEREFPVLDWGFEIGKPTMKGTIRGEDLTLKYKHKASSYFDEYTTLS